MKKGKSVKLNCYKSFKVTYGTVDSKNVKSIYINLQSWVEPKMEITKVDTTINNLSRNIKHTILNNLDNEIYQDKFIVDLDLRSSGIQLNKKSFMNLECYLYTTGHFDFKSTKIKKSVKDIVEKIISKNFESNTFFDFSNTKKQEELNYIES